MGGGTSRPIKTTPISPPSGLAQRLFQEPPAKSKFLAVAVKVLFPTATSVSDQQKIKPCLGNEER